MIDIVKKLIFNSPLYANNEIKTAKLLYKLLINNNSIYYTQLCNPIIE